MPSIASFLQTLRRQLNDDGSKQAWKTNIIRDAINEGLCLISGLRPDLFETTTIIYVDGPTDTLTAPEGFSRITDVLENVDPISGVSTGNAIDAQDQQLTPSASRYTGLGCATWSGSPADVATIQGAQPLVADKSVWRLNPPLAAGQSAAIRVTGTGNAPQFSNMNGDIPERLCPVIPALKSFVLMRMYEVDTESQYAADHAARYQGQVEAFIGLVYRQQAAHGSGWYMGNEGEGDEEARRR